MLVDRVRAGDQRAFGQLVDRHQDSLLAYVRHMGFGEAEALDLLQDAFVRAYRHLDRCGDPTKFDGWLFRIVANLCRTAGRKRSKRPRNLDHTQLDLIAGDHEDPEETTERLEVRERIREALDTLPEEQREALVLMYLQGFAVKEISERTGASLSAVKMRLKRGRDALKDELESFFPMRSGNEQE